jgi:L-malate glycosyltransferase
MNVAFIIDKFDVGGTQRQLILLANRLAEMGWGKVLVLCLQRSGPLAVELSDKIEVVALGLQRVYGIESLRSIRRLRVFLRTWECHILHTFLSSANIYGAILGKTTGVPVVVSRRDVGIYPGKFWQFLEEKVAYRLADSIVCVSREVQDILLEHNRVLQNKTMVIPNAIDVESADRSAYSEDVALPSGEYIVTVGNIKPVKAYDFLLESLPGIKGKVVVIGTGEHGNAGRDLERMRSEAAAAGFQEKILFLGHKDPPDVSAIVRKAAFAIHPSYSEGMSNAILEYMVHNNAVVCRDIPANRELVREGENGFLFVGLQDFTEKVNHLLEDVQLRLTMAENARRFVSDNHGLIKIMSIYVKLYGSFLS